MIRLQKDKNKDFKILNLTDFQLTEGEWQLTHKNGAMTNYTLDELFKSVVSQGKRKEIVVGDRFPFSHLAKEYGIEYHAAFPGSSSETEPSAKTVAHLSQKLKEELIPVVFTVEFSNKKVAKTIVSDTGAEILTLHSCHNVTNDEFLSKITYVELMTQNAENLRKALN
jgi:zinc transport system substrate-binding protein